MVSNCLECSHEFVLEHVCRNVWAGVHFHQPGSLPRFRAAEATVRLQPYRHRSVHDVDVNQTPLVSTRTRTHTREQTHGSTHARTRTHARTHTDAHTRTHTDAHTQTEAHTHGRTDAHTEAHAYKRTISLPLSIAVASSRQVLPAARRTHLQAWPINRCNVTIDRVGFYIHKCTEDGG